MNLSDTDDDDGLIPKQSQASVHQSKRSKAILKDDEDDNGYIDDESLPPQQPPVVN